jgi:hypothetical protein
MMSGMTGAERAEVMVRTTFGPNHGITFSPDGALLATAPSDATARLWDVASGAHLATLVPLPSGGYITLLPDARYKLDGDPGDCLWWAAPGYAGSGQPRSAAASPKSAGSPRAPPSRARRSSAE